MISITNFNNLENFLLDFCIKYQESVKDKIIEDNAYASNTLYDTFSVDIDIPNEGAYNIKLFMMDYFKYVDKGRGPGKFPPPPSIKEWIQIKPIIPRPIDGKVPTTNQLAFLIGRKIAEEGIKARNFLERTDEELKEDFIIGIKNSILKDVNIAIQETFNKYKNK